MSTSTIDLSPSFQTISGLARTWAVQHPELSARIARAVALVSNVLPGDRSPDVYFVEGSAGRQYMVRVNRRDRTSACTCPDHGKGNHCKHRIACALFEKGREIEVL